MILLCLLERIVRTRHGEERHKGMLSQGQDLHPETARTCQFSGPARISQEPDPFRGRINIHRGQDLHPETARIYLLKGTQERSPCMGRINMCRGQDLHPEIARTYQEQTLFMAMVSQC